jgi:hypothetical protein
MIRAYSQRILPPYSGFVQIAESKRARAQSFDGVSWEIQFLAGNGQSNPQQQRAQGYGLDRGYFRVAHLQNDELKPYVLPSCLDSTEVAGSIEELSAFLSTAQLPFPAADIYEYWLLDDADESPLALIFSCCEESQMSNYPLHTTWMALPNSKMKIDHTEDELARHEAPINHRFQELVARRAGAKPRTAWFKRNHDEADTFPGLLVREDWQDEADHDLCQRYLMRKAPRLLMLQGLSQNDRERLEIAAKQHVFEVEQYFPLYPEINDQGLMTAIRVEARLRRHTPEEIKPDSRKDSSTVKPLSKDLRILE